MHSNKTYTKKLLITTLVVFGGLISQSHVYAAQSTVTNTYPRLTSSSPGSNPASGYNGDITSFIAAEVGLNSGTANDCPDNSRTNPKSTYPQNPSSNTLYSNSSKSPNCYLLYQPNNSYVNTSVDPVAATRAEGFSQPYAEFEVALPTNPAVAQPVSIDIIDACLSLNDSVGQQDHGYKYNSNPGGDISVDVEPVNSQGYGSTGTSYNTIYNWNLSRKNSGGGQWDCSNSADASNPHNLRIWIPPSAFQPNLRYGSNVSSAIVSVNKNVLDGKKAFAVQAGSGAVVSYVNIAPLGTPTNNGDSYDSKKPSTFYNIMNLEDPSANFKSTDTANEGYNYGSINIPTQNRQNDYVFEFKPDCSYNQAVASGQNQIYLKWTRGSPSGNQVTQDYWELLDVSTNQDVNLNGANRSNYSDTVGISSNNYFYYPAPGSSGYDSSNGITLPNPNHTYQWIWHSVDQSHGLTVWMPFSEITTKSGLYNGNSCPTPNSQCSWIGAADVASSRIGTNYPNSGSSSGGSFSASSNKVWLSMNFYNNGGTPWQRTSYGIHFLAPGGGGSTNPLFNTVGPGGSYTIYGSNNTGTLQFNQPAGAVSTVYDFTMTDGGGNAFGAKCSITIDWPAGGKVRVQGHIYNLDPNGVNEDMAGVTVADCNGQTAVSQSNGFFYFLETRGAHYALKIADVGSNGLCPPASTYVPPGENGPYIRPWDMGSGHDDYAGCGPFSNIYTSSPQYCSSFQVYDWQWAGKYVAPSFGGINCSTGRPSRTGTCSSFDRGSDSGYDFVYTPQPPNGNVDSVACNGSVNGWSSSPADTSGSTQVRVLVQKEDLNGNPIGSLSGYFYTDPNTGVGPVGTGNVGSISTGIYDATGPRGDLYNGHGFNIPVNTNYQDGYRYQFFEYPIGLDMFGNADGADTGSGSNNANIAGYPGFTTMLACGNFATVGSPSVSLSPTTQNPTSYNTSSPNVGVTYANSGLSMNPGFNPGISMGCFVNVQKNKSSNMPPPNPLICSGSYSTNLVTINGPNGSIPPPVNAGDNYCGTLFMQYDSGLVNENGTVLVPGGGYSALGSCPTVVNEPTFRVFGSGVAATCQPPGPVPANNNAILSWNNDSGLFPGYGSGAQFSALAPNDIAGFGSGQNTSSFNGGEGLTFANANLPSGKTLGTRESQDTYENGGFFNGQAGCATIPSPTTYVATKPGNTENVQVDDTGFSASNALPGNFPIHLTTPQLNLTGGSLTPGDNMSMFVDGDVYINSNITYNYGTGGVWNTTTNTPPRFTLVATGNIYIDPNVTQLDGIYIAEPDSSGNRGKIFTCSAGGGNFTPMQQANIFGGCADQLVINGSFDAKQVNLMRSFGSLRDEVPSATTTRTVTTNNNDGTIPLNRYSCPGGISYPGLHFYQTTPTSVDGPAQPSGPAAPTTLGSCGLEASGYGYVLPPNNPGTGTIGLYFFPRSNGDNFYAVEPDQTFANLVARFVGASSATLMGYVRAPAGNSCQNPDTTPLWKFYGPNYNFYTLNPSEVIPGAATNGGVAACVFVSGNMYPTSTTTIVPTGPIAPSSCSNQGAWSDHSTCAAEVFNFSPELYLTDPKSNFSTSSPQYDSYTSLPPVL